MPLATQLGLPQNLQITASPVFQTLKLTDLTDGYVPYHVSDAVGLANSAITCDGSAVSITGGSTLAATLAVARTASGALTATWNQRAMLFSTDVAETGVENAKEISGVYGMARIIAANTQNWTGRGLGAIRADVRTSVGATGTITNMAAFTVESIINAGSTVITKAYGLWLISPTNTGAGSITGSAGIAMGLHSAATNNTMILLGTVTIPAGNFGIYSTCVYNNYIAGNVGLRVSAPVAPLEIEDAATTASMLVKITQDDANVYGLVIGNDTYSTTDTNGLRLKVTDAGVAVIDWTGASLTLGSGAAGVDYVLTFDGETNDGTITWMEDEDYFKFSDNVLLDTGSLYITEIAAAQADIAGKGQLWVKNATPNELWFTDDAGTDHQIAFV